MKLKATQYVALAMGVFMVSSAGIFARLGSAPSTVLAFYRLLLAALVLLPFALANGGWREARSLKKNELICLIAGGFLLAVHYTMWFYSLNFTTVSTATTLAALQPVFSIVLGALFLNERLPAKALIGCAVALTGPFIIGWGDFRVSGIALVGDILALVSGAVISGYFFCAQLARRSVSALTLSVMCYLCSAFFLGIFVVAGGNSFVGYDSTTWKCFFALALVSTIGGQVTFNVLLRWVSATTVTMSILGEPIGACILSYFILGETLTLRLAIGMVVILSGLLVFFRESRKQE